ncbi:SRPBCC family protein [Nocardia sp. NPDC051030]|uniref:SRPBCC family protein n=1 Tax=Nocardia sp. NPDC051030 TaxID=3155162 RepID=UPI00342CD47D
MHHIEHSNVTHVPVDECFSYVEKMENMPLWMYGMLEARPVGTQSRGLGTIVDMTMKLGPIKFAMRGAIEEYVENVVVTVAPKSTLISGRGSFRFAPTDEGGTRLSVSVDYEIGGGLAGRALAKVIDAVIDTAIGYSEDKLLAQLADFHAGWSDSVKTPRA